MATLAICHGGLGHMGYKLLDSINCQGNFVVAVVFKLALEFMMSPLLHVRSQLGCQPLWSAPWELYLLAHSVNFFFVSSKYHFTFALCMHYAPAYVALYKELHLYRFG